MGCAIKDVPARCRHPVVRGCVPGQWIERTGEEPWWWEMQVLYRDCDDHPCGRCGTERIFLSGPGVVPCSACPAPATAWCDFPAGEGRTCDLPLCDRHRAAQGGDLADIDFCPQHVIIARGLVQEGGGDGN